MSYTHLSQTERYQIQCLHELGLSPTRIAAQLGRHRSTIAREIERSGCAPRCYKAAPAQQHAQLRRQGSRCNAQRLSEHHWALVMAYLELDLSPQQVAQRLELEKRLRISHTWIYTHVQRLGKARSRLRCGQRRRKAHSGAGQLQARVGIEQRPAIVDKRSRRGDWEGDTIASGAGGLAAVVTLTERRSRYTLAQHVQRRQAEPVGQAIIEMLRPHKRRRYTLTLDNGKEFAQHRWVSKSLKTRVYFADPHSPWQRGLNENHNGLLRHYLPKGSDLGLFDQQQVLDAVYRLNHRPRRCLDWKTPHEVFYGFGITPITLPGWCAL